MAELDKLIADGRCLRHYHRVSGPCTCQAGESTPPADTEASGGYIISSNGKLLTAEKVLEILTGFGRLCGVLDVDWPVFALAPADPVEPEDLLDNATPAMGAPVEPEGARPNNDDLAKTVLMSLRPFFDLPEWGDMTEDQREHFKEAAGDAFMHVWFESREEALASQVPAQEKNDG